MFQATWNPDEQAQSSAADIPLLLLGGTVVIFMKKCARAFFVKKYQDIL